MGLILGWWHSCKGGWDSSLLTSLIRAETVFALCWSQFNGVLDLFKVTDLFIFFQEKEVVQGMQNVLFSLGPLCMEWGLAQQDWSRFGTLIPFWTEKLHHTALQTHTWQAQYCLRAQSTCAGVIKRLFNPHSHTKSLRYECIELFNWADFACYGKGVKKFHCCRKIILVHGSRGRTRTGTAWLQILVLQSSTAGTNHVFTLFLQINQVPCDTRHEPSLQLPHSRGAALVTMKLRGKPFIHHFSPIFPTTTCFSVIPKWSKAALITGWCRHSRRGGKPG